MVATNRARAIAVLGGVRSCRHRRGEQRLQRQELARRRPLGQLLAQVPDWVAFRLRVEGDALRMDSAMADIMPWVIIVVALGLFFYARAQRASGVLR